MNTKILLAFLGGAALASGIVYMAVKPDTKPVARTLYVEPVQPQAAQQPAQQPVEQAAPSLPAVAQPAPMPPEKHRQSHKPSPVQVARATTHVTPPVAQPTPSTTSAPSTPALPTVQAPPLPVIPPPSSSNTESARPAPAPPAPEPPRVEPAQPHTVTLAAGTPLAVRVGETLSTHRNKPGDTFLATLAEPLTIDEFVIAERGARCEGRVVEADPGGRVKGVARLGIELTSIRTSDGQRIRIRTAPFAKDAPTSRRADAAKVGGGAALGAIIGAIAGGGKGAGIGAAAGGAAGAGDVALTRGKPAEIPVETRVSFRVQEPVSITERLQ